MLIEFRVENHRSIREEQVFTMEAAPGLTQNDNLRIEVDKYSLLLLPTVAFYGANASGKSNVLEAFKFATDSVRFSHRLWESGAGVPRTPFGWGPFAKKPSLFEFTFIEGQTKYNYGFVVSDECIEEEWLYAWPNNRKQLWFSRLHEKYKIGEHLKGQTKIIQEVTRPNALYLSVAAQHRNSQIQEAYRWFRNIYYDNLEQRADFIRRNNSPNATYNGEMQFLVFSSSRPRHVFERTSDNDLRRIQDILKLADVGIVEVKKVREKTMVSGKLENQERLLFRHDSKYEHSWLNYEDESHGTRVLIDLCPKLVDVLDHGGMLIVDELEASLHPHVGRSIVRMFQDRNVNRKRAQLIFSTHDTNLLGSIYGSTQLSRDQIWFTEKDRDGATKVYPLTDFRPRKSENLERGYLQGRYGAIPFVEQLNSFPEGVGNAT